MKALLVDSVPTRRRRLKRLIEAETGLGCHAFAGAPRAFAAAGRHGFDLVIVDHALPGLDGPAFTRRLRATSGYGRVPVVMLVPSARAQVRIDALASGVTEFLPEAPDATEIKVRLRTVIDSSTAARGASDRALALERAISAATQVLREREEEMVARLHRTVEYRDDDTGGHTTRVARYSRILAETLGLPPETSRAIELAAPLHDIGKVAIPDAILRKPARLDPDERTMIEDHAAIGKRILGESRCDLIQLAAQIAGAHHERWDGKGYPHGLKGRAIPLAARIVAIADVFDALTSFRPYKAPMSVDEAFACIERERGAQFDPDCVDAFLAARPRILTVGVRMSIAS